MEYNHSNLQYSTEYNHSYLPRLEFCCFQQLLCNYEDCIVGFLARTLRNFFFRMAFACDSPFSDSDTCESPSSQEEHMEIRTEKNWPAEYLLGSLMWGHMNINLDGFAPPIVFSGRLAYHGAYPSHGMCTDRVKRRKLINVASEDETVGRIRYELAEIGRVWQKSVILANKGNPGTKQKSRRFHGMSRSPMSHKKS